MTNISKSKGNQTMQFGQLIEYNMRKVLLKKSCTKCGEKLFSDPFLKSPNWLYLWIIINKIMRSLNIVICDGINNCGWFKRWLNLIFWSGNSSGHLQRSKFSVSLYFQKLVKGCLLACFYGYAKNLLQM